MRMNLSFQDKFIPLFVEKTSVGDAPLLIEQRGTLGVFEADVALFMQVVIDVVVAATHQIESLDG